RQSVHRPGGPGAGDGVDPRCGRDIPRPRPREADPLADGGRPYGRRRDQVELNAGDVGRTESDWRRVMSNVSTSAAAGDEAADNEDPQEQLPEVSEHFCVRDAATAA